MPTAANAVPANKLFFMYLPQAFLTRRHRFLKLRRSGLIHFYAMDAYLDGIKTPIFSEQCAFLGISARSLSGSMT
jgi:hypothetical protein